MRAWRLQAFNKFKFGASRGNLNSDLQVQVIRVTIISSCSLHVTRVCELAPSGIAAFGFWRLRHFSAMRVCRRSVPGHARLPDSASHGASCSQLPVLAALRGLRLQHRWQRGLWPHRRLQRLSARPNLKAARVPI